MPGLTGLLSICGYWMLDKLKENDMQLRRGSGNLKNGILGKVSLETSLKSSTPGAHSGARRVPPPRI